MIGVHKRPEDILKTVKSLQGSHRSPLWIGSLADSIRLSQVHADHVRNLGSAAMILMKSAMGQRSTYLPAGMEVRPTQMRPFMKVPVVRTTALHWKVMPKNVFTPAHSTASGMHACR